MSRRQRQLNELRDLCSAGAAVLPTWMERILPHIDFESAPTDTDVVETEDDRELVAA